MRVRWKLLAIDLVNFVLLVAFPFWAGYRYWFFSDASRIGSGLLTVVIVDIGLFITIGLLIVVILWARELKARYVEEW